MLAFLLFTALLIAALGLTHKFWNTKRDKQLELDEASRFQFPRCIVVWLFKMNAGCAVRPSGAWAYGERGVLGQD